MRHSILSGLMLIGAIGCLSTQIFAVDSKPIERKIENSDIMARVQLVGVIAGGATKTSGIAVIKNSVTGRTYAIKTGDSLPGVAHIKLTSVRRGEAVFNSPDKEYLVRLINFAVVNSTNDHAATSEDSSGDAGGGLFDHWNEYKNPASTESSNQPYVSPTALRSTDKAPARGPMITGAEDVPVIQRVNQNNDDDDNQTNDYQD